LSEHARDREQPQLPEGQRRRRAARELRQPDELERLPRSLSNRLLLATLARQLQDPGSEALSRPRVAADHRVPEHVEPGDRRRRLEDGREPSPSPPVRRPRRHVLPLKDDAPGIVTPEAGDAVEERGLPGAVGADQAGERAGLDVEGDLGDGPHCAERLRDGLDRKRRKRRRAHGRLVSLLPACRPHPE